MPEQMKQVLELFSQPAFITKDDVVLWCNAAAQLLISEGTNLFDAIEDRDTLLSKWNGEGTAHLSFVIRGKQFDASVRRQEDVLLFVLSSPSADAKSSATAVINASAALRKPLHSLLGAATELFERANIANAQDAASQLNRAVYQLMRLCGQMSDGGRLLLQQMDAYRSPVNVQLFFRQFVSQVAPLIESAGRTLVYSGADSQIHADVDANLLERALFNLIANALSYTPKGGTITLSTMKQERRLFISVSDTGEGISPDQTASVFDRHAVRPIGDARWGLGYGLRMVREIARLHGGTMMLNANPNGGTTAVFSISLEQTALPLRSPMLHYDYCSGLNHALVELSEALDAEMFHPLDI